ncbi:hypothetical protein [Streptomyces griseoaurantiacus]|uniref:hypothetical protein n=1 Tax=Streptomyces griseoaurantiacus TaxID=68213 RepID=UPI0037FF8FFF
MNDTPTTLMLGKRYRLNLDGIQLDTAEPRSTRGLDTLSGQEVQVTPSRSLRPSPRTRRRTTYPTAQPEYRRRTGTYGTPSPESVP